VFNTFNEVPVAANAQVVYNQVAWPLAGMPASAVGDGQIVWHDFVWKGDGSSSYKVKVEVNKISNSLSLAPQLSSSPYSRLGTTPVNSSTAHAAHFFQENFDFNSGTAMPRLGEDLYVDVRVKLVSHAVATGSQPVPLYGFITDAPFAPFPSANGMSRVVLGVTSIDDYLYQDGRETKTRFAEVNLWRDSAYDGCVNSNLAWWGTMNASYTSGWSCDTNGLYDRRVYYGSGEVVVFHGPALGNLQVPGLGNLPTLSVGSNATYTIPLTKLFTSYFINGLAEGPPPADWSQVSVHGVYIGIETWGKADTKIEIDNYRLYAIKQ
jgi:hypothetical protein